MDDKAFRIIIDDHRTTLTYYVKAVLKTWLTWLRNKVNCMTFNECEFGFQDEQHMIIHSKGVNEGNSIIEW
jgi:hypothetical protein